MWAASSLRAGRNARTDRIPTRVFSTISSTELATCESAGPAATNADNARPLKPGDWPEIGIPSSSARSNLSSCSSSRRRTRFGLMSPARHRASGHSNMARVSSTLSSPLEVSIHSGTAGIRPGTRSMTRSGTVPASSKRAFMPGSPSTLPISCGSAATIVVPRGMTARAYSATVIMELSRWTCGSMKPGAANRPSASMTRIFRS